MIIVIISFVYFIIKNNLRLKEKILLIFKPSFILPLAVVLLPLIYFSYDGIINIYEKFLKSPDDMGWTSYRIQLWADSFEILTFTGNQDFIPYLPTCEYFFETRGECGVHNNYIHQALKFGIMPALLFSVLVFYFALTGLINYKKYNSFNALISCFCAGYLIIFYMFETGAVFTPFWIMIIFWSLDYSERRNEKIT